MLTHDLTQLLVTSAKVALLFSSQAVPIYDEAVAMLWTQPGTVTAVALLTAASYLQPTRISKLVTCQNKGRDIATRNQMSQASSTKQ